MKIEQVMKADAVLYHRNKSVIELVLSPEGTIYSDGDAWGNYNEVAVVKLFASANNGLNEKHSKSDRYRVTVERIEDAE